MEKLIEKYGQPLIDLVIKIDDLSVREVKDLEYLEDRIITHIERLSTYTFPAWSTINNQ
jgi:hypothetical protein